MAAPSRILLIEDNDEDAARVRAMLAEVAPCVLTWVRSLEDGVAAVGGNYDACLLDFHLGDRTGIEFLEKVRPKLPDLPIIVLTGHGGRSIDVAVIAAGASDYLPKDELTAAQLERSVRHAVDRARIQAELRAAQEGLEAKVRERTAALEREVVERRQAESRAEAASQAKSDFLALMSHELRTPLNAIIGFSEIMQGEMLGPLGADGYRDYVRDINASGRHLLEIVNDVLDFAQIDSGTLRLPFEPMDAADSVRQATRAIRDAAEAAGLVLSVDVTAQLPISANARGLSRALAHILSNAVKFTPAGGRITVTARAQGSGVAITVADTGIGMDAEGIKKALEPFRQVDDRLSRAYEGVGLGLPLARNLVQLQGGKLSIDSTPGRGTTVSILLPG